MGLFGAQPPSARSERPEFNRETLQYMLDKKKVEIKKLKEVLATNKNDKKIFKGKAQDYERQLK